MVVVRRWRAYDPSAVHHLAALGVGALQAARVRARQPPPRDGAGGAQVGSLLRPQKKNTPNTNMSSKILCSSSEKLI